MARTSFERVCADILPTRPGARLAIALANCYGGWTFCDPQIKKLIADGPGRVSAYLSVAWFPAAAQGQITIKNQLKIPALTFYRVLCLLRRHAPLSLLAPARRV
jgi:hypothetical protein